MAKRATAAIIVQPEVLCINNALMVAACDAGSGRSEVNLRWVMYSNYISCSSLHCLTENEMFRKQHNRTHLLAATPLLATSIPSILPCCLLVSHVHGVQISITLAPMFSP